MLKEFREFISKGSVMDLAVGIIIGAAFTTIVNSLVNDIIMPPLGLLIGGIDFTNFFVTLKGVHFETLDAAKTAGAVTVNYGLFINAIIKFLLQSGQPAGSSKTWIYTLESITTKDNVKPTSCWDLKALQAEKS